MALLLVSGGYSLSQTPSVNYRFDGNAPPGAIGNWQLQRGGPLPGYFQPVDIKAPTGAMVSLAAECQFDEPQPVPRRVGILIGGVYRLRLTNIPLHEGVELYPTIELIDRIYPPCGREWKFPIPIDLTADDIELALQGKFVTRIVYLEDPETALPAAQPPEGLHWFEVGAEENPLQVADGLGRPLAIVRIGNRVPDDTANPGAAFLFGSPPWVAKAIAPRMILVQPELEVAPERIELADPDTAEATDAEASDVERNDGDLNDGGLNGGEAADELPHPRGTR
jgi:hypothetical protein